MKSSDRVSTTSVGVRLLNQRSDIADDLKLAREQKTGEVKEVLAWSDGRKLVLSNSLEELNNLFPERQVKRSVSTKGVLQELTLVQREPRVAIWCVAVNEGDGFHVFDGAYGPAWAILARLKNELSSNGPSSLPPPPSLPIKSDILSWLEGQRNVLVSACHQMATIDHKFARLWTEHEETTSEGGAWPSEGFGWPSAVLFPHTLQVAIGAFQALHRLHFTLVERLRELPNPKDGQLLLSKPYGLTTFLLRIARDAHHAGVQAKALQAMAASHVTLSTLGAAKNVRRSRGERAKFIIQQDDALTKRRGAKPSTLELMNHLDGQTDPETHEKIMRFQDEDGTWTIQWGDGDTQTRKQFAVKLSELRKKSKRAH